MTHYYHVDEPSGPELQLIGQFKDVVNGQSANMPDSIMPPLRFYGGLNPTGKTYYYWDTYIHYTQYPYFVYDWYLNYCYVTPSSDIYDTTGFQYWVDEPWIGYMPSLKTARTRCDAMTPKKDFWIILPTYGWYGYVDLEGSDYKWVKVMRLFTPTEMEMLVNLSLLYGAHGIGYWAYLGRDGTDHTKGPGEDPSMGDPGYYTPDDSSYTLPDSWSEIAECSTYTNEDPPY